MNELEAVVNYSAFFWFWDNMLYYGYMPSHNIPVCTPYSPGESATYYIDNSGKYSARSTNLLESRGVTPQGKIDPEAKAVNINVAFNGYPSLQNPSVLVGELLQLEKKNNIIRITTSFLMLLVFLEVLDGYMWAIKEVSVTPQAIIQSGIKTVCIMVVDGGWTSIANPSIQKYVL